MFDSEINPISSGSNSVFFKTGKKLPILMFCESFFCIRAKLKVYVINSDNSAQKSYLSIFLLFIDDTCRGVGFFPNHREQQAIQFLGKQSSWRKVK